MVPSSAGMGIKPLLCLQLEPLCTTWGSLSPPLGNTRLHVVKLLASALSANDAALTQELLALDVPNTMLVRWVGWGGVGWGRANGTGLSMPACIPFQDLFFHYVFNNFLHTQVEVCVSAMLSAEPPSDGSLEMPTPNPGVKHVSCGSRVSSPFIWGWALPQLFPSPVLLTSTWWVTSHLGSLGLGLVLRLCVGEIDMSDVWGGEWTQ